MTGDRLYAMADLRSIIRPDHYINLERPQHHVPKAAVPAMGAVSNRRFIDRMVDWGWETAQSKGEHVVMTLPTGDEVWVCAPQVHNRNPLSVFNEVMRCTGDIDWTTFWTTDVPAELRRITAELEAELEREQRRHGKRSRQKKEERRRMAASQPARVIDLDSASDVTDELQALERETEETREHRTRVQPRVLALLMESGEPWAISNIAKHLGINNDSSVSGACGRLMQQGLVRRVAHGVYQAVRTGGDHKVHISVGQPPEAAPVPLMASFPTPAPEIPAAARTAPPSAPSDPRQTPPKGEDQWEETINEVLDLMFPNGFKARHLPLIDRWRQATTALMRELQD